MSKYNLPRYARNPRSTPGRTSSAVVVGGSIAGLLAARTLADHFDLVTILERDRFPGMPGPRKGVPQARFIHVLLVRGQMILEQFFPGIGADLEAAGAPCIDWTRDVAFHSFTGWGNRFPSGLLSFNCSRDLLEGTIRRRLSADTKIRFREGCEVTGLIAEGEPKQVVGVKLRLRGQDAAGAGSEEELFADLVVDAGGRTSSAPKWLAALGYGLPEETVVNSYLGYATRWFEPSPGFRDDWQILMVRSRPPHDPRGGVISRIEGGRWIVGLSGANRDYPPTDEVGFMEFARSLSSPVIYELIKDARPVSPIYGYRRTENRLRHYDKLPGWPEGFIALGDAVCAFNPVYGQGMTVAALGAATLQQTISAVDGNMPGLARRFQRRLAKVNAVPWLLATGEDFRWPAAQGGRPGRFGQLVHRYMDQIIGLIPERPEVQLLFIEVAHLLKPPASFFKPDLLLDVLTRSLKNPGTAVALPAAGQVDLPTGADGRFV